MPVADLTSSLWHRVSVAFPPSLEDNPGAVHQTESSTTTRTTVKADEVDGSGEVEGANRAGEDDRGTGDGDVDGMEDGEAVGDDADGDGEAANAGSNDGDDGSGVDSAGDAGDSGTDGHEAQDAELALQSMATDGMSIDEQEKHLHHLHRERTGKRRADYDAETQARTTF